MAQKVVAPSQRFSFSLDTPSHSSGTLDKYLRSILGNDSTNSIPELLKPPQSSESSGNLPQFGQDGMFLHCTCL